MNNSFFKNNPEYTVPKAKGNYTEIAIDEEIKLRVLSQAITGYDYFNDQNKPVRQENQFKSIPKDIGSRDGKQNPIKHFWAMVVWNYDLEMVQIWEIPQSTIQNQLFAYAMDKDFGDLRGYDIKITRTGKKLETKYMIKPLAPKDVPSEATESLKSHPVTLEALYTGQNPFSTSQDDLETVMVEEDEDATTTEEEMTLNDIQEGFDM